MSDNVYTYINGSVEPYLRDPPDTEFSVAIWPHC